MYWGHCFDDFEMMLTITNPVKLISNSRCIAATALLMLIMILLLMLMMIFFLFIGNNIATGVDLS